MREFLLTAAIFVLATVAVLGTGGIAALVLATGGGVPAAADVALTLAILAAFVTVAFVKSGAVPPTDRPGPEERK